MGATYGGYLNYHYNYVMGATYEGYLKIHNNYVMGATYGGYLWGLPNNSLLLCDGGYLCYGGYLTTQYYIMMGAT